jgi:hypothetical protein
MLQKDIRMASTWQTTRHHLSLGKGNLNHNEISQHSY